MRSCRFFVRREGVLGIGHLVVFLFNQCITCSLMEVAERKENTYEKKRYSNLLDEGFVI